MSSSNRLLKVLQNEPTDRAPFWFMRQAGRYLPEYRQLRQETGSFLDLCYSPKQAAEVTIQPIRRFGMDAAIIFSDILVIPHGLGNGVTFEEKIGPVVEPIRDPSDLARLKIEGMQRFLQPVYDAISETRAQLSADTALIGFAGMPWTLACYLLEGKTTRDYAKARVWMLLHSQAFTQLIDLLCEAVVLHLKSQVDAGAQVVQLFDSWAGVLSAEDFQRYCQEPAKRIVQGFRTYHPHTPIIAFPKGAGSNLEEYARQTGVNAVSADYHQPLARLAAEVQPHCVVQGNLDPLLLAYDQETMLRQARVITQQLGNGRFIFNLGHGIIPETPIANVEALSAYLRGE